MEQYGNSNTFNIESVLIQNIKESHYFAKKAMDCDTVYDVIDEIYETVDHVEPWLSGNARGPSSAFCLLYRLGQLRPSAVHVREMLDHQDSPYIRALGFLYLRFTCNPRELWSWFKDYMEDSEKFSPSPTGHGKTITIGTFARDILLDQYYFETIFPRVPKLVSDDIKSQLHRLNLPTEPLGNGGQGGRNRRGGSSNARPASVKASLSVAFAQRAPNRAGAREEGRGLGADINHKAMDSRRDHRRQKTDNYSRGYSRNLHDKHSPRRSRSRSRTRESWDQHDRRHKRRYRSRSRSRDASRKMDGRDASSVFRDRPLSIKHADDVRRNY